VRLAPTNPSDMPFPHRCFPIRSCGEILWRQLSAGLRAGSKTKPSDTGRAPAAVSATLGFLLCTFGQVVLYSCTLGQTMGYGDRWAARLGDACVRGIAVWRPQASLRISGAIVRLSVWGRSPCRKSSVMRNLFDA